MSNETHKSLNGSALAAMADEMLVFITGPVLAATLCPGMTLCVPGLVLFGAAIIVPLVILGAVATVCGAAAAMVYLVGRSAARVLRYVGFTRDAAAGT